MKAKKMRYHEDKRFRDRLYPPIQVPKVSIAGRPPIPATEIKSPALDETELAAVLGVLDAEPSATQANNRSQKGSGPG